MPAFAPRRPLRALFVHKNFPGQYAHLAPVLAERVGVQVYGMGEKPGVVVPGVRYVDYGTPTGPAEQTHRYIRSLDGAVRRGQMIANRLVKMRNEHGFRPDIVVCHPGWGDGLFLKDIFPAARTLYYCEFYYNAFGQDIGFETGGRVSLDDAARVRMLNATQLVSLQAADWTVSPTRWQRSRYPDWARRRMSIAHEGVDTQRCAPREDAFFRLPDGRRLRRGDPVISYVARNLEPYRGFPSFMKALAVLQKERPQLEAVVVGGDEVSYGSRPDGAENWRTKVLAELEGQLDLTRIHFIRALPHDELHQLFRITRAHVYLTYPFVLSWSMLESMACGAVLVGSATPPVQEVIEDGVNGLLVPFTEPERIAETVLKVLNDPAGHAHLAEAGRRTVVERYDLFTVCLPRQLDLIERVAAGLDPAPEDDP